MQCETAASVISFISQIERESAEFYEKWATKFEAVKDLFLSFARENGKNEKSLKRAYFSGVTDALEVGFSFGGLSAEFSVPALSDSAALPELLQACLTLEDNIQSFYRQASELSKHFLSDLPKAMERVATHRGERKSLLLSLTGPSN